MPQDNLMNDFFSRRCTSWRLVFNLLPRRCYYTGKYLWLKKSYYGIAIITGPGEPVVERRWCEHNEFLLLRIKGLI